jgi:RNA polymerase sigma factor (sigma-70 family)
VGPRPLHHLAGGQGQAEAEGGACEGGEIGLHAGSVPPSVGRSTIAGFPTRLRIRSVDHCALSDRDLLQRWCRHRDERAAEQLSDRLQPFAERVCRGVLGDGVEAADLAQEAVAALLLEAGSITGEPGAWLRTCATRRCLMWLRSQRRRRQVALERVVEPCAPAARPQPVADDPLALVEAVMAVLRPAERELMVRYYLQGETQDAVAEAASVSQPAIARRLAQALQRLRGDPRLQAWFDHAA